MGSCSTAIEGNAAEDLQQTCVAGNVTDRAIGFGDLVIPATGWALHQVPGSPSRSRLTYNNTSRYTFAAGTNGFIANVAGYDLGVTATAWRRGVINHFEVSILNVGDGSSALDDEMYIIVEEPAAGNNDLTLPVGAIGWWYRIRISVARAGNVRLDVPGAETINGGAAPIILGPGLTTYTVIKETANDWRAEVE